MASASLRPRAPLLARSARWYDSGVMSKSHLAARLAVSLLGLHAILPGALAEAARPPAWVSSGGKAPDYPEKTYLTGFGAAEGPDALERAKLAAAADLAQRIRVRIRQQVRDSSREEDGRYAYEISSITAASTDVKLVGLSYETHVDGARAYCLAHVRRVDAVREEREARAGVLARLDGCLSAAGADRAPAPEEGAKTPKLAAKPPSAERLRRLRACRRDVQAALQKEAAARAVAGASDADRAAERRLREAYATIGAALDRLAAAPARSLEALAGRLAAQLTDSGALGRRVAVAPPTYGTSRFSSSFGRALAKAVERGLAAEAAGKRAGPVAVTGSYYEDGDVVRIALTARDAGSGALLAGATDRFAAAAVPAALPLKPQNFAQAMAQDRLLSASEVVSGDLRVDVWTNKGSENLVFEGGESLKLYMRVNQPCYVRLVYLLASGAKVPLEQAYYIDASKVNRAVEYPDEFEVSPPFGVEQLYAVAFRERPAPLPTERRRFGAEDYDVITSERTLVRHRGLKRKKKGQQTAEAVLSLTTVPRQRGAK